jgi:hypothetical protein
MHNIHGKYVYSTLALGKEREIVKEETALTDIYMTDMTCT